MSQSCINMLIPSQWEGLHSLFREDMADDEHQVALNTMCDTCFLLKECNRAGRDFTLIVYCLFALPIRMKIVFIDMNEIVLVILWIYKYVFWCDGKIPLCGDLRNWNLYHGGLTVNQLKSSSVDSKCLMLCWIYTFIIANY